jgi:transposase
VREYWDFFCLHKKDQQWPRCGLAALPPALPPALPKKFPPDRRESVLNLRENGFSIRNIGELLKVSKTTVQRWIAETAQNISKTNTIEKSKIEKRNERPETKLQQILQVVEDLLDKNPFFSCKEIRSYMIANCNLVVSKELIRTAIKKLMYSYKKARYYGVAKNALQLNATFLKRRVAAKPPGRTAATQPPKFRSRNVLC